MRIGTLVKIRASKGLMQPDKILAWYEDFSGPLPNINAKIFESAELYGLYMGSWDMEGLNAGWFVKVFIEDRTYILNFDEIEEAECPPSPVLIHEEKRKITIKQRQ